MDRKGEIDSNTIIEENLNTSVTLMDRYLDRKSINVIYHINKMKNKILSGCIKYISQN